MTIETIAQSTTSFILSAASVLLVDEMVSNHTDDSLTRIGISTAAVFVWCFIGFKIMANNREAVGASVALGGFFGDVLVGASILSNEVPELTFSLNQLGN